MKESAWVSRLVMIFGASVTAIRSRPRPGRAGLLVPSGSGLLALLGLLYRRGPPGLGLGHHRPLRGHPGRVDLQAGRPLHPVEGSVLGNVIRAGTGSELGHQPVEGLRGLGTDEPVVDLHAGRAVAVGQALSLLEGQAPVGGGAAGIDPERRLGVLEQCRPRR